MSEHESVRLETERLVLRPPVHGDATAAAELLTDLEVMRFLGGETVALEHVGSVVARWQGRWESDGVGPFMIERREDGRFLGRAGILVWDTRTWTHTTLADAGSYAQPELGWALIRAAWGSGYATEAADAVRRWVSEERGIVRLISLIDPENGASQRVAQRLGAAPTETVSLSDSGEAVVWVHPSG